MQDLTIVGLTEDSARLVLVSDAGEEFAVRLDARFRAALRGEHARLGQLEIQMESALRPRDIQARIRAGETPESVAQAGQTTVDRIMGYATPVLAERAHVADRAQRSSVRRRSGEGPARLLGDAVAERLRERDVDPDAVSWDAWRRRDGRWTLVADYPSGEARRHAEFLFDAPGRYVVAEDDEARWLVGEQSSRRGPQPRGPGGPRRLASVPATDELPLGADAIDLVSDATAPEEDETVDLGETVAATREHHPGAADPGAETGDADWVAGGRAAAADPVENGAQDASDTSERTAGAAGRRDGTREPAGEPDEAADQPPAPRKASRRGRRPSVPSWDEIMFGGGHRD